MLQSFQFTIFILPVVALLPWDLHDSLIALQLDLVDRIRRTLLDLVPGNELVLFLLKLVGESFSLFQFFVEGLGAELGRSLLVLGHTCKNVHRLLLVTVHLIDDVLLEYFFDQPGEFADSFVEEWEKLVGLQAQILLQLINCLELQAHAGQSRRLHIGERNSARRQDKEV